ncbi:hypothetical protein PFY12_13775 [Chryseobacterium camelliae]|uniref:Uncharacterized protein n=1 Tax=Chryseobacterium camelliae TaxID=1265445 RepID=A0ABY7QN28_9FLAO|nr:hypothetical protein [Chryseobacterium camelliae]WBV60101.1 hypothetical protein PFY12_13775 [Chryseobacterium camelliae]
MKNTEKKILEKAKIILKDLQGEFFNEKNIEKINFSAEKEITVPKNMKLALWTIVINEPIFDSTIFLCISDEDAEPLYIRSKHKTSEIIKNSDGIYIRK